MDDIGQIIRELNDLDFVVDAWLDPDNDGNVFDIKVEVRNELKDQLWEDWFGEY